MKKRIPKRTSPVRELLTYGPAYAAIQALIRHPEPLEPDRLWELVHARESSLVSWVAEHYPPRFVRRMLLSRKLEIDHQVGIAQHYDVSNDFYGLFLDKRYRFYSSADFGEGVETLEAAQQLKADFLLGLMAPQAGDRILDLGCGWGAMLRRIVEETSDRDGLTGFTLSKDQVAYCTERGLNVEFENFITCSYPESTFDLIYSIGAWEHVRHRDVNDLLRRLHAALKPGGRLVKQFFCPVVDEPSVDAVIAQIFFPGSLQPAYAEQMRAFEDAGFRITHESRHDYRPTLREWFRNLASGRDRAVALAGVETYNKYLVFFAASHSYFDRGQAVLGRYVWEKVAS